MSRSPTTPAFTIVVTELAAFLAALDLDPDPVDPLLNILIGTGLL
jgi:hypothetical protein